MEARRRKMPAWTLKYAVRAFATVALGVALTACSTVATTTPGGERKVRTQEEFRDYVEQVFRFQNRVVSDLINRYELGDASGEIHAGLLAAEAHMEESCHYLNEMVTTYIDGHEPSLALKKKLMDTIDDCDYAAREVAHLIGWTDQAVAVEATSIP